MHMYIGLIVILILYTVDYGLLFISNSIRYVKWSNFYPSAIHYGFLANFHPNAIRFGLLDNFHLNAIHFGFWRDYYPNTIFFLVFGVFHAYLNSWSKI